jgi:hypothetical protein
LWVSSDHPSKNSDINVPLSVACNNFRNVERSIVKFDTEKLYSSGAMNYSKLVPDVNAGQTQHGMRVGVTVSDSTSLTFPLLSVPPKIEKKIWPPKEN